MVITSASQAENAGSIPVSRSNIKLNGFKKAKKGAREARPIDFPHFSKRIQNFWRACAYCFSPIFSIYL